MDVLTLSKSCSKEDFWFNFCTLKDQTNINFTLDFFQYLCDCQETLTLFSGGEFFLDGELTNLVDQFKAEKIAMFSKHLKEKNCSSTTLKINPEIGHPDNIVIFFGDSDMENIKNVIIEDVEYEPTLIVKSSSPIFALYKNKSSRDDDLYKEFIIQNFETYLNSENVSNKDGNEDDDDEDAVDDTVGYLAFDDDSVNQNQGVLPRLFGGGRRLMQEFKYICQWCPREALEQRNKGRFRELKNYRDHFRRYHSDIPMREFLTKVQRNEPKFFCKICRRKISLGNQLRHQIICRPIIADKSSSSSSSSDQEEVSTKKTKSNKSTTKAVIDKPSTSKQHTSQSDEEEEDDSTPDQRTSKKRPMQSSSESSIGESLSRSTNIVQPSNTTLEKRVKMPLNQLLQSEECQTQLRETLDNLRKRNVEISCVSTSTSSMAISTQQKKVYDPSEQSNVQTKSKEKLSPTSNPNKAMQQSESKIVNIQCTDEVCEDDEYDFETQMEEDDIASEPHGPEGSSTIDSIEKPDNLNEEDHNKQIKMVKWWQGETKSMYCIRNDLPLQIFYPTDSEEFVNTVQENFLKHTAKKKELDNVMAQMESSEEKLNQFSDHRDLPYLKDYEEFVSSGSTKDVLGYFSPEYDTEITRKSATSSTAKQYSYRIMEFFNYMAKKFKTFHLDWLFDYGSEIQKKQPDGTETNEIFIPPQDAVNEFLKSYLYGSNPAANIGLRIFAMKKLLEMLIERYPQNEEKFPGTLYEKRKTVKTLVKRLTRINDEICPAGTIKHLSIASNRNHRKSLAEKIKKCPQKSLENIMKGVSEYLVSAEYNRLKKLLYENAYEVTKVPSSKDYTSLTSWVLEMLVCIGGNRPVSLLGITVKDWEDRKPGFCPFNQSEENDLVVEDPQSDNRKILANPYQKPSNCESDEPTGVIVMSEADKISVGPPCYIWFPTELEDLVKAHSLMASKFLPRSVDIYHPNTRLFMNSQGNLIKSIECKHFKDFIGLPIVCYDFRRSLSTFCLDSQDENIRKSEPSILRHSQDTAYAYYHQKHGQNVEYVNIKYAVQHGLVKATEDEIDSTMNKIREKGLNEEWELTQKRNDKALAISQDILRKNQERLNDSTSKGGRIWITKREYKNFMDGIMKAISTEEEKQANNLEPGPFSHLLHYLPGTENAGVFPTKEVWWRDMCRVLFGLQGPEGESMRLADLTVYDGIPFGAMSGRKKIQEEQQKKRKNPEYLVVAQYWRDRIKDEALKILKGKWDRLRFIFTQDELDYFNSYNTK